MAALVVISLAPSNAAQHLRNFKLSAFCVQTGQAHRPDNFWLALAPNAKTARALVEMQEKLEKGRTGSTYVEPIERGHALEKLKQGFFGWCVRPGCFVR